MLLIALHLRLTDFTANEALGIKDGVGWVGVESVLGRITNSGYKVNATAKWNVTRKEHLQSFLVRERYPRRCDTMTLIIGNNFYTTTTLHAGDNGIRKRRRVPCSKKLAHATQE